jgi:aryl-alcohol dehydrogenase
MTRTIAAVVHQVDSPFAIEEVELDNPRPDEVLVRMVATGLCHTDLSVQSGVIPFPLPGVVGHEGAGIVEAVGASVTRVSVGDHVLASFTSCGGCANCVAGHPAYCIDFLSLNLLGGRRADGSSTMSQDGAALNAHFFGQSSLAQHALVDERSLVKVDADAPLDILAPLGCGIQTGAGAVLNVLKPEPGSTVAVFGAGAVGVSAVMAARLSGATRIIAVDLVDSRLALAQELGATDAVNAAGGGAVADIMALTGGGGVSYSLECSGSTQALADAIAVLAPLGACALIGAPKAGSTVPVDVNYMLNGRRLVGVTEGDSNPEGFIPALVELWRQGRFPIDRMMKKYAFQNLEQAAHDAHSGAVIKAVLTYQ